MTTQKEKRCSHCGVHYWYYTSGYNTKYNSDKRCPDCQCVYKNDISIIFNNIPKKFESREKEVKETIFSVTKEDIKRWISDLEERRKTSLIAQRVCAPIFDLVNDRGVLDSLYISASDGPYKGREFRYEYWTSEGIESMTIYIEMEYDLEKDEFTGNPWY